MGNIFLVHISFQSNLSDSGDALRFTSCVEFLSLLGSREVSYKDRLNMPYTDAVIRETMRKANVVPTALPHTADIDLYVDGLVCTMSLFGDSQTWPHWAL